MSYWTDEKRRDAIAAMRRICDFLEANPEFTMPSSFSGPVQVQNWDGDEHNDGEQREWFLRQAAMLGPDVRATQKDEYFYLRRDFGGTNLCLMCHRTYLCDSKDVEVKVVKERRLLLRCPDEVKALGFTDPGEVVPDFWESERDTIARGEG